MTTYTLLSLGNALCALAAPMPSTEPPMAITIATVQVVVTAGAPMTWHVTLTPRGNQSIGPVELRPGDTRTWAWPDGFQTIRALTNTVVLDVSAVPLVIGDLFPTLEARYTVGGDVQMQLITGNTLVRVEPVETRVETDVIVRQGTAREDAPLPVELWIRNRSPFTLTQVQVRGSGADLLWGTPIALEDVLPTETFRQELIPLVEGQHPQPQLSIEYTWTDATGATHTQTLHVSGEAVPLAESIPSRIPKELLAAFVGVLTGALVAIIPSWIEDWRSRRRQKRVNRQHVHGLLRLMILQSEHAADNGVAFDLAPLEAVFKEEGLFTVLEEDVLSQSVRELWKTAERHNSGLDQPGGAQRSEELRNAARELGKKLELMDAR